MRMADRSLGSTPREFGSRSFGYNLASTSSAEQEGITNESIAGQLVAVQKSTANLIAVARGRVQVYSKFEGAIRVTRTPALRPRLSFFDEGLHAPEQREGSVLRRTPLVWHTNDPLCDPSLNVRCGDEEIIFIQKSARSAQRNLPGDQCKRLAIRRKCSDTNIGKQN